MHERILNRKAEILSQKMITRQEPIPNWQYRLAEFKALNEYEFQTEWQAFQPEDTVFKPLLTVFFKTRFTIPQTADYFYFPLEYGEALLSINGEPYSGNDRHHHWIPVKAELKGKTVDLAVEMMSNLSAMCHPWEREKASIAFYVISVNQQIMDFYYDTQLMREAIAVERNARRKMRLEKLLEEAMLAVDLTNGEAQFLEDIQSAGNWLRQQLQEVETDGEAGHFHLTGNSHIDVSWLWPYAESVRKACRTFSSMIRLLEKYPEFVFNCSQPQLYQFVKDHAPTLYAEMKKWAKTGRFEVCGAMWVETDCNVPSGESITRQMLYGSKFFQEEFGVKTRTCWLPDVFGYPASLPTILKHAEVDFFLTTKLHWQAAEPFPTHLFHWKGLDGTTVLTHIPRLPNFYGGTPSPGQLQTGWDNFAQKGEYKEVLFPFGHGDGGGGVTVEMLEYAKRLKNFPGLPTTSIGAGQAYFEKVEQQKPDLPIWDDELYLQTHRGTYTTQADVKKYNRKLEFLFHNLELLSIVNRPFGSAANPKEFEKLWKVLLLHQFHDDLPGSSIPRVYEDTLGEMKAVTVAAQEKIDRAMLLLVENSAAPAGAFVFFNPNSIPYSGPLEIEEPAGKTVQSIKDEKGREIPFQKTETGKLLLGLEDIPPLATAWFQLTPEEIAQPASSLQYNKRCFENRFFKIQLNPDGTIAGLIDKAVNREIIAKGQAGNLFELFQDGPDREAAWNIHDTFEKRSYPLNDDTEIEVTETGPVRMVIQVRRSFRRSKMVQHIILYDRLNRIDFDTWIDWQERQVLLKVAFPVEIRAKKATYEIQYGAIERNTHNNLIQDKVQFEVCGHRWADLSEADYGVSLLNDSKYGYDVKGNKLRLTLLRGADFPDPKADLGEHRLQYALYPHQGNWTAARTVHQGLNFNNQPLVKQKTNATGSLAPREPLFLVDKTSVMLDTIKPAEDGNGIVIRLYESSGARGQVSIRANFELQKVVECSALENPQGEVLSISENRFSFLIQPFEVKSFRVE